MFTISAATCALRASLLEASWQQQGLHVVWLTCCRLAGAAVLGSLQQWRPARTCLTCCCAHHLGKAQLPVAAAGCQLRPVWRPRNAQEGASLRRLLQGPAAASDQQGASLHRLLQGPAAASDQEGASLRRLLQGPAAAPDQQ